MYVILLYCNDLEPNPQYLSGMPVICIVFLTLCNFLLLYFGRSRREENKTWRGIFRTTSHS